MKTSSPKKDRRHAEASRPQGLGSLPAGTRLRLPPVIVKKLKQVSSRQRWVNLAECAALLLAILPSLWVLQAAADWCFNLPWSVRLVLFLADLGLAGYLVYRFAFLPLRQPHTLEIAALRVEREIPEFRTSLISAVELAAGRPGSTQGSLALVHELISRVGTRIRSLDLARRVVKTVNLRRWSKWAALGLIITLGLGAAYHPNSLVLLRRILLGADPLPTRTVVVTISSDQASVAGADVALSARAQGVIPRSGLVQLVYANGDRQEIPVNASPEDKSVFSVTLKNVQQSFRYRFSLNDGTGETFSVRVSIPPVLESLDITQQYPAYTGLAETTMPTGSLTLLAGSKVRIQARSTQPLGKAIIHLEGVNEDVNLQVEKPDARSVHGEFTVPRQGLTGLSIILTNTEGVASQENTIYHVELQEDHPPSVELTAPAGDRLSVLLTARPVLIYSVKDDFAVKKLALKYELTHPASPTGDEAKVEAAEIPLPLPADGFPQTYTWNLEAQKPAITEGCTLTYWIEATDNNDATGPGIGRSPQKTFSVVSKAEKRAELLEILGAKAAEIEEISNTQKKINDDLDTSIRKTQP